MNVDMCIVYLIMQTLVHLAAGFIALGETNKDATYNVIAGVWIAMGVIGAFCIAFISKTVGFWEF